VGNLSLEIWPIEDRLLSKINKADNGCWIWTGCTRRGYGSLGWNEEDGTKVMEYSHRLSWLCFRGEIPDGLNVLHKCDTKRCINPDHLFLGTQRDNIHDSIRKGRQWWQNRE
jgi:hypothetical protein